jgi:hypothetical protein
MVVHPHIIYHGVMANPCFLNISKAYVPGTSRAFRDVSKIERKSISLIAFHISM